MLSQGIENEIDFQTDLILWNWESAEIQHENLSEQKLSENLIEIIMVYVGRTGYSMTEMAS